MRDESSKMTRIRRSVGFSGSKAKDWKTRGDKMVTSKKHIGSETVAIERVLRSVPMEYYSFVISFSSPARSGRLRSSLGQN